MSSIIDSFSNLLQVSNLDGPIVFSLLISGGLLWVIKFLVSSERDSVKQQIEASLETSKALQDLGNLLKNITDKQESFSVETKEIKESLNKIYITLIKNIGGIQ